MMLVLPNGTVMAEDFIRESFGDKFADRCVRAKGQWPGSELKQLLKECGIVSDAECGCEDRVAAMNRCGVEWCKANRTEIIGWLKESAAKRGWWEKLEAANELRKRDWWSPLDRYGSIVSEALRRAEIAAQTVPAP